MLASLFLLALLYFLSSFEWSLRYWLGRFLLLLTLLLFLSSFAYFEFFEFLRYRSKLDLLLRDLIFLSFDFGLNKTDGFMKSSSSESLGFGSAFL